MSITDTHAHKARQVHYTWSWRFPNTLGNIFSKHWTLTHFYHFLFPGTSGVARHKTKHSWYFSVVNSHHQLDNTFDLTIAWLCWTKLHCFLGLPAYSKVNTIFPVSDKQNTGNTHPKNNVHAWPVHVHSIIPVSHNQSVLLLPVPAPGNHGNPPLPPEASDLEDTWAGVPGHPDNSSHCQEHGS